MSLLEGLKGSLWGQRSHLSWNRLPKIPSYRYLRFSRNEFVTASDRHNPLLKLSMLACSGCLLVPVIAFAGYLAALQAIHLFRGDIRIPSELVISGTVYANEKAWGPVISDGRTGLIIYSLDEKSVGKFSRLASSFPQNPIPAGRLGSTRMEYGYFRSTPVNFEENRKRKAWNMPRRYLPNPRIAPRIKSYIFQNYWGLGETPMVLADVEKIITSTGSYYSYGKGGSIIIVAPRQRWVIYAYSI